MKTHTVKTYSLRELSDSAKDKAREWYRSGAFEDGLWHESTIDECVEQGRLLGITFDKRECRTIGGRAFHKPKVWFRGFYSQGDGACFEGSWNASDIKADKVAEDWGDSPQTTEIKRIATGLAEIAAKFPESSFHVKHSGHYYHEYCTEFDFDFGETSAGEAGLDGAEEDLKSLARDFMKWIYRQLEAEWDYQNSDEAVDEAIEANDYQFYGDGSRAWRHD